MKLRALVILFFSLIIACKSGKSTKIQTKKKEVTAKVISNPAEVAVADAVVINAMAYEGVKYKYGGTTKSGMDCSGLVYTAFKEENIYLPRISRYMAKEGEAIPLNDIRKGDLVFFMTRKKNKGINHVGLVVDSDGKEIRFIHSSTSKGVITSSLSENYWRNAYVTARRVL